MKESLKQDLYGLYWILKTRTPVMTAVDKQKFNCQSWEELAIRINKEVTELNKEINLLKNEIKQQELF